MPLNKSTGNMYDFITHTWNTIKGECPHGCSYCYMKRWGKQPSLHFDEKELKTDLGKGNFIFVGSSCDMFAESIPENWVNQTITKIEYDDPYNDKNKYLFQTKNPHRFFDCFYARYSEDMGRYASYYFCTTLETNRHYKNIMDSAPPVNERVCWTREIPFDKYITVEPIMDFDLPEFIKMIKSCDPVQVNIGADSSPKRNKLPEPPREKILALIEELEKFTVVVQKKNLARLLK